MIKRGPRYDTCGRFEEATGGVFWSRISDREHYVVAKETNNAKETNKRRSVQSLKLIYMRNNYACVRFHAVVWSVYLLFLFFVLLYFG